MSYQVLARKWRPRSFPEMVGQEHVLRALINALDNNRLHHAFLFTGTRGVGKTTVARILAKSLNCEQGVTSQPCGHCSACTEIDEGRFVDLIEVDAASRTKVEDTRELLENVQYAPTRGRYKVYLIDEVHMLSTSSFNALLKTLEEPPPHVKFLLATTDPQKLPATILSRCLQFSLKRLSLELIRGHLADILGKEGIAFEAPALVELARAADGSMRDALSLLDQAIAFGGGSVQLDDVRAMLGTIDRDYVHNLLSHLAAGDAQGLLQAVAALAEQSPDFSGVLDEMNSMLQRVALAQMVPNAIDDSLGEREAIMALAAAMSPEDVQLYYQIGIVGRRDLPLAPEPRGGFEMVLLRMLAFRPDNGTAGGNSTTPVKPAQAKPAAAEKKTLAPESSSAARASAAQEQRPAPPVERPSPKAPAVQAAPAVRVVEPETQPPPPTTPSMQPVGDNPRQWAELVAALPLTGMTRQMAEHCALVERQGDTFTLAMDPGFENLYNKKWEEGLRMSLSMYLGSEVRLVLNSGKAEAVATPTRLRQQQLEEAQQAAERSIAEDPKLQAILEQFEGEILSGSIRPLN